MNLNELQTLNARALSQRPYLQPGYRFRPISHHDPDLHRLKRQYPYFGYVEITVEGIRPFLMFSNNDDTVAQIYFWFGPDSFESASMKVWRRLTRSRRGVVLDIGAYTGVYALAASFGRPDADIHAFEPVRKCFGRLTANLVVNRMGRRIGAHNVAVGAKEGKGTMHLVQGELSLSTGSSLEPNPVKPTISEEPVRTICIDDHFGSASVSTVKIDVERAELDVLKGMQRVIRSDSPDFLIEISSGSRLSEVREYLRDYNYAVIDDEHRKAYVGESAPWSHYHNVLFRHRAAGSLDEFCRPLM